MPLTVADVKWAVGHACLAPSVHNTQPWRFSWDGSACDLYADLSRGLPAGDPDGRELVISCGAALYNLRVALRQLGCDAHVDLLPDPDDPRLLARVAPSESRPADPQERRVLAALRRRHTHRAAFDDLVLEPRLAVLMQRAAEAEGAELLFVADPGQRRRVLSLARAAERAVEIDPEVVAELDAWTPPQQSRRTDGVPVTAYAADPVAGVDDLPPRDFDHGRRCGLGDATFNTPGRLAVLVTSGDLRHDWLTAGQALERVLVDAAAHGVFAALHSQIAEVPNLRSELRRELGTVGHPHLLLRFGYAEDVVHSPRRPVDDVLEVG